MRQKNPNKRELWVILEKIWGEREGKWNCIFLRPSRGSISFCTPSSLFFVRRLIRLLPFLCLLNLLGDQQDNCLGLYLYFSTTYYRRSAGQLSRRFAGQLSRRDVWVLLLSRKFYFGRVYTTIWDMQCYNKFVHLPP